MEGYVIVLAVFALLVLIFWYKCLYSPYQVFKKVGIPNPPVVPFIGNAMALKYFDVVQLHEQWIKKYGKVFGYYVGAKAIMVIADPEMVKEITVKHFDNFSERIKPCELIKLFRAKNNVPTSLVFMKEHDWRRIRPIVSPTFSAKKLKWMIPLVERSCNTLNDKLTELSTEGHSIEMWSRFSHFTMETILETLFGSHVDVINGEANELTKAAKGAWHNMDEMFLFTCYLISTQFPPAVPLVGFFFTRLFEVSKDLTYLTQLSLKLIEERKQKAEPPKNVDFLQLLMEARAEDSEGQVLASKQLTIWEILTVCIDFILAGYETSTDLLAYTVYLLAINQDVQDKLYKIVEEHYREHPDASLYDASHEIPYIEWVINESLRIYSPAPRTGRHCKKTIVINGVTIPAGVDVEFPSQYLQRSPEHWDNPYEFRPERFSPEGKEGRHPLAFIPFGWGPRNCVGLRFAMIETKMCILSLVKTFRFERAPDTQVPLKTKMGISQYPRDGIHVKVIPRS